MGIFAKRVRNPEVCFIKNYLNVILGLSQDTTNVVWAPLGRDVLNERGLMAVYDEHAKNLGGYIVEDCYPTDRRVLMNYAEALFEVATLRGTTHQNNNAMVALMDVIKKMHLTDSELRELLRKYVYKGASDEFLSVFLDLWKDF